MGHGVTRRLGNGGTVDGSRCGSEGRGIGGHAVEGGDRRTGETMDACKSRRMSHRKRVKTPERRKQRVEQGSSWESGVGPLVRRGRGWCVCSSEGLRQSWCTGPPSPLPAISPFLEAHRH